MPPAVENILSDGTLVPGPAWPGVGTCMPLTNPTVHLTAVEVENLGIAGPLFQPWS